MTTERAWTEDPATLLQHQVLHALAATGETEDIEIAHAIGSGPAEVREVFTDLVRSGLAVAATRRAGDTDPYEVSLTRDGNALARQREAARTAGAMRRRCESTTLTWVFALDGRHVTTTDELAHDVRGWFFGVPFDELTPPRRRSTPSAFPRTHASGRTRRRTAHPESIGPTNRPVPMAPSRLDREPDRCLGLRCSARDWHRGARRRVVAAPPTSPVGTRSPRGCGAPRRPICDPHLSART